MKKKALCMMVLGGLLLAGCSHEHVWLEATCTAPATCAECGETEGKPTEHHLSAATCTAPATCRECGETTGEALEHDFLMATCAQAELCSRCGEENGEPLAHTEQFVGECPLCHRIENKELVEEIFSKLDEANIFLALTKGNVFRDIVGKKTMLQGGIPWGLLEEDGVTTLQGVAVWGNEQLREVYSDSTIAVYADICRLYEEAAELCGGYEGLEELQARLHTVVTCAPVNVPMFAEEDFAAYDALLTQCDQSLIDEALAKFGALWGPFLLGEEAFYEAVDSYWPEAVRVAESVGMTVAENWQE
ncbi:MAG: hypothetical protein IJW37_09850 [Lachnospiraceae bacterium]|nr:hypothetical protein [Lachnospiraceae bacterium]